MIVALLVATLLDQTPAPACELNQAYGLQDLFSRSPVGASGVCTTEDGVLRFDVTIANRGEFRVGYIKQVSLSFRGVVDSAVGPPGWVAERRARADASTEVVWRASRPSAGVKPGRSVPGFSARVSGANARLECWRTYSTSGGAGGVGDCVS